MPHLVPAVAEFCEPGRCGQAERMPSGFRHIQVFLTAAARNPQTVGAVIPTSAHLAERLAGVVPAFGEPVVVELGPGTGPITAAVQRRLAGRGRHLAVELDPILAQHVAREYPDVEVVLSDAVGLGDLLAERDISEVDAVVSALPWSLIRPDRQHDILDVVAQALCPGAPFTTIAYLHARLMSGARGFRALLDEVFDEVLTTSTVWRNLPPAVTYVCRRSRTRHGRER